MKEARRIEPIKSAIFAEMNAIKAELEAKGVSVINLGIGSPDQPPPAHVVERLKKELDIRENYDYATSEGLPELREAVSVWYKRRFKVDLNPESEVLTLMGSHDGLAHICLALLNPGDVALVPDPHYPVYKVSALLAEAKIHTMPLLAKNNFLPDFEAIPEDIANQAKIIILNYPNNPITAVADYPFCEKAVDFARTHDILLCHDAAYSELTFGGFKPPSILQVPGAKDIAVEFHSVSKTYNIAGCRLGFAVGNPDVIGILARLKTNLDYGVFKAIQYAGVAALLGPQDVIQRNIENYEERMRVFVEGIGRLGWEMEKSKATMFLWAPVPGKRSSRDFAIELLKEAGVLVIPGNAFGDYGEGYVRIALVKPVEVLRDAIERIGQTNLLA
ncbi:MAG: LL-diaminopimelate aminotransferase [Actinomycetota bacterium]